LQLQGSAGASEEEKSALRATTTRCELLWRLRLAMSQRRHRTCGYFMMVSVTTRQPSPRSGVSAAACPRLLIRQVQYLLSSQLTFISEGRSPMTEDRDKWRKYVHGVANSRSRTAKEQNRTTLKQRVDVKEIKAIEVVCACIHTERGRVASHCELVLLYEEAVALNEARPSRPRPII